MILPRTSEGLYLLQRVRDEAHRFAITYHRQQAVQADDESVLDDVPGLGEARRKALLRHFGSLKRLRAASAEEIAAVPGIGAATAAGRGGRAGRRRAARAGREPRHGRDHGLTTGAATAGSIEGSHERRRHSGERAVARP